MNLIHASLEIFPFLSGSIRSKRSLAAFSPSASVSCGLGTLAFPCAKTTSGIGQGKTNIAMTNAADKILLFFHIFHLPYASGLSTEELGSSPARNDDPDSTPQSESEFKTQGHLPST